VPHLLDAGGGSAEHRQYRHLNGSSARFYFDHDAVEIPADEAANAHTLRRPSHHTSLAATEAVHSRCSTVIESDSWIDNKQLPSPTVEVLLVHTETRPDET
jgi:hypothetical protein